MSPFPDRSTPMQAPAILLPLEGPPVRLPTCLPWPRLRPSLAYPGLRWPGHAGQQTDERAGTGLTLRLCFSAWQCWKPPSFFGTMWPSSWRSQPALAAAAKGDGRWTCTSSLGLTSCTLEWPRPTGFRLCPPKNTGPWGLICYRKKRTRSPGCSGG